MSSLTLIMHAAVLVLLAGHEGLDLRLGHLLSCRPKGIRVKITLSVSHAASAKQTIYCPSIFGEGDLRPTQGGQHNAQLSAHDCAISLLVKDAEAFNVVVDGALGEGVDLLQHGHESVKVEPLVGHICRARSTRLLKGASAARLRSKVNHADGRRHWQPVRVLPSALGLPRIFVTSLLVGFWPRARMMSATWLKAT